MKLKTEYIVHIGTVRVTCLKVLESEKGVKEIASFSACEAEGFERGVVKDLSRAAETLREVVRTAVGKEAANAAIPARIVISHPHLKNFVFGSSLYFYDNPHALAMKDVRDVIAQTRSVATIPLTEMIIQAVPQEFLVNDLAGIANPIGLEASRLGVSLRLFSMDYAIYNNLVKALERADVEPVEFIPTVLTSAHSALTREEREEGAVLADVGGHAVWFGCYKNGILVKSDVMPFGSEAVTEELGKKFNLTAAYARRLKETYVAVRPQTEFSEELVPIEGKDKNPYQHVKRLELDQISQSIVQDLILRIRENIERLAQDILPVTQVVFTGGGSKLNGFLDAMQDTLPYAVRLGMPRNFPNLPVALMDASYSDIVGAVDYTSFIIDPDAFSVPSKNSFLPGWEPLKRWVSEYF